ncbi:MAG: TrmJ/YjtD family RNA methyltransferase [Candidatus Lokiarchaeota archaeon]|nr:TrmJ/YjtD family RNA methyltransferase [Candidatus Lokiarchaeota archaeon]
MNKKKHNRELSSYQEIQIAEEYRNLSFTVVLVRPEHSGNVGSIARVMKNFNFKNLIIFNPIESKENIFSHESQGFAMHGKEILMSADLKEVEDQKNHMTEYEKLLKQFDLVIATTAKGKKNSNIRRLAIFPMDISLPNSVQPLNIAILFGRESRGLTNDEISLADILLRIPTGLDYPALNISHACGVILYEIFKKLYKINIGRGTHPVLLADREDRQLLQRLILNIINKLKTRTHKKENVKLAFRNVFERAIMSKRELSLITGVFSKVNNILEELNLYEQKSVSS